MKNTVAFVLIFVFNFTFSQKKAFNDFVHLSISDGLSQSSVITMEQDQFGQMWIGTRNGLNKYDGEQITVYKSAIQDSSSLSNNDILSLKEDKFGNIWIGTHKGLNKYDPKSETFQVYQNSEKEKKIADNIIYTIAELKNGELWFGTANGLMKYNHEDDSFSMYRTNPADTSSLSANTITAIHQDGAGDVWVGTASGLYQLSQNDKETSVLKQNFKGNNLLKEVSIQSITSSKGDSIWIGTKANGLLAYQKSTNAVILFNNTVPDTQHINKDVRSLVFDRTGNLWVATYEGLFIKNVEGQIVKVVHQPGIQGSLSRNTLKTLFLDKKGSIWIGAYYGGVNIWDSYNINFSTVYRRENNRAEVLGVVSSIVADQNGNLYFATEGNGIVVIDSEGNTHDQLSNALNRELIDANIKSLLLEDDRLWIGTFNQGVFVFDIKTMRFNRQILSQDLQDQFLETGIYSIAKEGDTVFFGSFGKGLFAKDLSNSTSTTIIRNQSLQNAFTNNNIRVLHVDSSKNLWIGTESGINLLSGNNSNQDRKKIKYFLHDSIQKSGEDILSIYEDSKGSIYVGTKNNGLFRFGDNNFKPVEISLQNFNMSSVYSIVEDNNLNLWISCDQGIVNYNPRTKEAILYNQNDGMVINEFKNNSCIKTSNGTIYFGTANGAFYFDPGSIEKNMYAPQVILTGFSIQGQKVKDYKKNKILDKNIKFIDGITLPYNKASFSISFALPNFINAYNNTYAYRMTGLDDEWKYGGTNEINYTIQNAGDYVFEILGANNDGVWNETPTRLAITVKPSPWRSPWAFLLYALAIITGLFIFNRINKAQTDLKHKLELEHLENIRQEEINTSKLQFFTNISHEFRTPLALIIGPLQQLLDDYQGSNKVYKKLLVIERNANQLLKLINQILDFRKFENEHSTLQAAEGNIVKFLKEIYLSFQEYAKSSGYSYTFSSSSDKIEVYYDRNKLEKVFFNLLSNAFKNTPGNGKIEVKIKEKDAEIEIEVTDNGKGIDKEFVDKVFNRFYEIAANNEYQKQFNQGSGIGLSIAKKAVELHKGFIEVDSVKEQGTTFRVILKKGRMHLTDDEIIDNFKISDDIAQYEEQMMDESVFEGLDFESLGSGKEKLTVLVAEDNDELRKFISDILKEFYTVIKAENGAVAFKKALQKSPDLIVSDVIMPEMEGTELCAKIKNDIRTSHIPFILLTSRSSLVYKVDGLESGADAYVSKPFNVKEFLLTIRNLLSSVGRLKEKFSSNIYKTEDFTITSIDEELLKKAIKIVEDNISNTSFDIPFFSTELGVSRTMLFTKIKGWTNLTPNEFIHSIRMKRASQLLELGEINVSEVCYKVGFRNPKYFTKCFKKHFNQTPTEYASKFF